MSEQVEPISAALRISHYSTLGVDEHATQAQIRDAYRRSVQRCHPDRFQGIPEAEAAFKEITIAYKVLREPRSRRDYDRRLGLAHARRDSVDEAPDMRSTGGDGEVDDRDMQRFENVADGHARRGVDAPGIAGHLIAAGSPYQLAWHLAWQARRRVLAHTFEDQGSASGPTGQPSPHEVERGGNWQESRDRHRKPFQALMARMKGAKVLKVPR